MFSRVDPSVLYYTTRSWCPLNRGKIIIFDCFDKFGYVIDPLKYYTLDNIGKLDLTIEDVEESLGIRETRQR